MCGEAAFIKTASTSVGNRTVFESKPVCPPVGILSRSLITLAYLYPYPLEMPEAGVSKVLLKQGALKHSICCTKSQTRNRGIPAEGLFSC